MKIENLDFDAYNNRIDPEYYDNLLKHISAILSLKDKKTETEINQWKEKYTIAHESDDVKTFDNVDYKHTLHIDFIGLAASTFLIGNEAAKLKYPNTVKDAFKSICKENFTDALKDNQVSLRIRFIFPYLYSNFSFGLMECMKSKKGGGSIKNRKTSYNFDVEEGLDKTNYKNSRLWMKEIEALEKIEEIIAQNKSLVVTEHNKASHTLQVRFTTLPINMCTVMIGNLSYNDPYLFTKQKEQFKDGHFFFPVIETSMEGRASSLHVNIAKSFDYYWANELTLFCGDSTDFKPITGENKLTIIKKPQEVLDTHFMRRIERTMHHIKKAGEPINIESEQIAPWLANLKERFRANCSHSEYILGEKFQYKTTEPKTTASPTVAQSENSIAIGFRQTEDESGEYFFKLKADGLDFKEFKFKKRYKAGENNRLLVITYKILLHYCLVAKGILKKGSMFEMGGIDFETKRTQMRNDLLKLLPREDYPKADWTFFEKCIMECHGKNATLKIQNINIVYNLEDDFKMFRILQYGKKVKNRTEKYIDVLPQVDLDTTKFK
ncbi:hypothetical protein [Flavobacterium sp.]|uniref:hypothetical protein n=1 Tax=Flavobacterium sp. TaxID=239 RepID=UPI0039E2C356